MSSWWPFGNKKSHDSDSSEENQNGDRQPLTNNSNDKKQKQKKKHPLYGTTITIESPATTPKISHVKHGIVEQEAIQRLQQQQQRQPAVMMERSDSMPAAPPTASDGMFQQEPSPQLLFHTDKPPPRNDSLETDDYSLESTDYSDIRPSLMKRGTDSIRSAGDSVRSSIVHSVELAVDATFRLPGRPSSVRDAGGTASIPNEIFNLIKNIVGAGAFGLPRYAPQRKKHWFLFIIMNSFCCSCLFNIFLSPFLFFSFLFFPTLS